MGNQAPCCADKAGDEAATADTTGVIAEISPKGPMEADFPPAAAGAENAFAEVAEPPKEVAEPPKEVAEPPPEPQKEEQPIVQSNPQDGETPTVAAGMEIEFSNAGTSVTKTFVQRPLGFKFSNTAPPKVFVTDIQNGSIAQDFGVAKGWELVKVNGKQVESTFSDFQQFMKYFKEEHDKLPAPQMEVVFMAAGERVAKTFNQQPVGIKFSNAQPPKVFVTEVQPGSPAQQSGVAKDWQILEVNGKAVESAFTDFQAFMTYFGERHNELLGPRVEVVFLDGDQSVTKVFTKQPLGFKFSNLEPSKVQVTVVGEGGQAAELGVKVGWELAHVNGKPVSGFEDLNALMSYLKDQVGKL